MQTILGAGGDVANLLAKELTAYTDKVRLVSRNPQRVNETDELMPMDITDGENVLSAISGSEVVYLTVGHKYDLRVWQALWPVIVGHVIAGCVKYNCKLVFFDNIYMYDKSAVPHMTEESKVNPPSRKGKVRSEIADMILSAVQNEGLNALIARSADFYGPSAKNGIINMLVVDKLVKDSKPNWQANADKIHSFTYLPDAARATALLGNTDEAYGQVWHLPTSAEKLTGRQFISIASTMLGKKNDFMLLKPWMLTIFGLFSRMLKELVEMQYQNTQDYFFDSEKFCKAFSFTPTPYDVGIRECINAVKN